ncbi:hypothetical protein [Mesorhizobium japonicum]|uniref:hypothetical protein n=1 Tax=Mesorhizobium japonicum TaxID=2066070 RepID=UPI0005184ACD|nr:hypothetical protein CK231_20045 [Mesorhizobium loti]PBB46752.1 hypothetical protein CK213_25620 [Mesorhizobium loti]
MADRLQPSSTEIRIIFAIAWTHLFTPFVSAGREIEAMPVFGADAPGIRFEPFLSVSSATLAFAQQYDGLNLAPTTFRLDTT